MYEFSSKYPAVISIILIAAAVLFSILSYRKRDIDKTAKIILITLRSIAISLLLILFIEPSVLSFTKKNRDSYNIVLVDNSRSNLLPFGNATKEQQLKNYLSASLNLSSGDKLYSFSNSLSKLNKDSVASAGYETNLSDALKELRQSVIDDRVRSLTIISDGVFNAGRSPLGEARLFNCPVNVIAIGDTIQNKDIILSRISFNPKEFTKSPVKIRALIDAYKFNGANAEISFLREGSVISKKSIPVNSDVFSSEIEFETSESSPGIIKYSIEVTPLKDEITPKNNTGNFFIDYLDNSTKILFVSGGPGYDNAVVQNIFKRIESYKTTFYTLKTSNSFYEGSVDPKIYPDLSAVFLLNFPVAAVQAEIINSIAENVTRLNIPVVFFAGKNTDYQKLGSLMESLPFSVSRTGNGESTVNLQNVSARTNEKLQKFSADLSGLPNVYKNISGIVQKTGSEVLLIDKSGGEPMLVSRISDKSNSTAFLGYGFWKWNLNPGNPNEKQLEKLLMSAVNLTIRKEKKKRLVLELPKTEFDYLENSVIYAHAYDENFNVTQNAVVKGRLVGKRNTVPKDITFSVSDNLYKANLGMLPADDYTFDASAEFGNVTFGNDNARFISDTTTGEFKLTTSDFNALRTLADNTGGIFSSLSDNKPVYDIISASVKTETSEDETVKKYEKFNLWENRYILFISIMLLAVEWLIKKRKNIP